MPRSGTPVLQAGFTQPLRRRLLHLPETGSPSVLALTCKITVTVTVTVTVTAAGGNLVQRGSGSSLRAGRNALGLTLVVRNQPFKSALWNRRCCGD